MVTKTNQGNLGPQYLTAFIVNILSFAYGIAIGWTAPMQPLLQAPATNETSFWDTSVKGLSDEAMSWIGGVPCIGGFLATPIFGYLANAMGRKKTLIAAAIPFLMTYVLKIMATNEMFLYIARTLAGIGGAGVLCVVPMYMGEIADDSIRGVISAFFNLFMCFGILTAFIVGSFTSYLMLSIVGLASTITFLILFIWCPESPVYLIMNKRSDEAYTSLKKLRGNNQELIQNQVNIISTSVNEMSSNSNGVSIREMINDVPTRKALAIVLVVLTVQQSTGISPIVNYTVSIFEASGSQLSPSIAAIIVGSLQTLGATFATILIDKAGRRMLLILSCVFMSITLSAISYFLYLKGSGADETFLQSIGWLPVTSLAIFVVSYGLGIGPVSYVLISELFKAKVRSTATSICMLHLWFLSFIFLKFFSTVSSALGIETCFAFFAACCVFGAIFTYFCIIETKGKPLETILHELGGSPPPDSRASPIPFFKVENLIIKMNVLSFSYGVTLGWTAPMQPLLQAAETNETSFWDTSVRGLSDESMSWIGGTFCIGGMVGTPIFGYFANVMGRKKALMASAIPLLATYIFKIMATNTIHLYIARILAGVGGAGTLCVVPMYIGETAEDSVRGVLSSYLNLFICTGILVSFVIGSYTSYLMLALVGLACTIIFLILVLWCPESPVYSLINNRPDEAYKSLTKLRGNHQEVIQHQVNIISTSVKEMASNSNGVSIREMLTDVPTRKALLIALTLMTVQQATGVGPILNYTVSIFEASGSQLSPSLAAIIVGALQIVGALIGTIFMDRAGRKLLLILSSILMSITLSAIAYFLYLKANGADESTLLSIGWLPVTSLAIFIVSFGLGFGPVPFVLVSELFKTEVKGTATSICILHLWFVSFIFLKFFSNISSALGIETCFGFFAASCVFGAIFTYFFIIETKGKPLETILSELSGASNLDSRASPIPFFDGDNSTQKSKV